MRRIRYFAFFILIVMLFSVVEAGSAEKKSANPLLDPIQVSYTRTKDKFIHILFLGLDVSSGNIRASGNKRKVMDSHTDVIMLLSVNLTKGRMDLLSIPRDSLCYVPGVHGVYKINAAFNTATNYNEGFRHVKETVGWFLGGLKIDYYCAVDLAAMRTLTNLMGGIDYDLEISFTGGNNRKYKAGFQHLDGDGIVDYIRARHSAPQGVNNDMARTKRNRDMMLAIFDRLKSDANMINELWAETQKNSVNFFTDTNGLRVINDMWDFIQNIESAQIGSYMIPGTYEDYVLGYWSLNITDQKERVRIIKELYGYTADELPFTSKNYCKWLLNGGFQATQNIRQARLILDFAKMRSNPSKDLQKAITTLDKAIDAAVTAYDTAAVKLRSTANKELTSACKKMRTAAEQVVKLSDYKKDVTWEKEKLWYQDPLIMDYPKLDWR